MGKRGLFSTAFTAGLAAGLITLAFVRRQRRRIDFAGRVVVITGGSRGLGLVLARQLGSEGARLVLLARDEAELDAARRDLERRGVTVRAIPCDVSRRDEVEAAIDRVVDEFGRLDVLINNAGIAQVGPLEHMTIDDFEAAMGVHFWGPLYATFAVLPVMRRQGGGRIVNVASIGGQVAVPHLAPYAASKFALVGFSDAARSELARDGIEVSTISPGLMRTGSPVHGQFKGQHSKEYAWFSVLAAAPLITMDARRTARQIVHAARYGVAKRTLSLPARLLATFEELFPNLTAGLMKWTNRLLPVPAGPQGDQARTGLESQPSWMPSWLTALSDRAARENNELPAAEGQSISE